MSSVISYGIETWSVKEDHVIGLGRNDWDVQRYTGG